MPVSDPSSTSPIGLEMDDATTDEDDETDTESTGFAAMYNVISRSKRKGCLNSAFDACSKMVFDPPSTDRSRPLWFSAAALDTRGEQMIDAATAADRMRAFDD